jgi:hypothetical protein
MNDAMTSILPGKLNASNLWRNFFHGKFGDGVEAGEGVSNRLLESSKIDAPALISAGHFGLDFWISDFGKISPGVYDNTLSLRALRPFDVAQGMLCARYSEFWLRLRWREVLCGYGPYLR